MRDDDLVLTPDGSAAPIIGVYPQGEQDVYRVMFDDGTSTECGLDHLWEVHDDRRSYKNGYEHRRKEGTAPKRRKDFKGWPRVLTLREILEYSDNRRRRLWIPLTEPVAFDERPIPLPAYSMGALLGDGSFRHHLSLTGIDPYIVERVREELAPWAKLVSKDEKIHLFQASKGLRAVLGELGLDQHYSHEKFIPECYRYNTEAVRLDVVRGLLDTDGSVMRRTGQPFFEITSERLAYDMREVVQSLGGTVGITTKQGSYVAKNGERVMCRTVYRCRITHPDAPTLFALPRKVEVASPKLRRGYRTFRTIEFSRRTPTRCIDVGHPDHLYMTNDFIVTHNTVTCLAWLLEKALTLGGPGKSFWWVAPVYNQAEIGYRRMELQIPPKFVRPNASKLRLTLSNGALIEFKSAERAKALYGDDVYAAVLDECSHMREEAWDAVLSTVTKTEGQIRLIGNVRGRKNWFYKMARIAEAGDPDMSYAKITAYEAIAEGVLTEAAVERARRRYEKQGRMEYFNELYLAEPSEAGGNPFGLGAIDDCVGPLSMNPPRAAGIDFAGRGAINATDDADRRNLDWTAVVLLDKDGAATHIERFRLPNAETMERVERIVGRVPALGDSTGAGDMMVELLQRRGKMNLQGYVFNSRTKQDLMENLAVMIQNKHLRYPDGDLRDELDSFEFEYGTNSVKYAAAPGSHDDLVVALSLAAFKLPKRRHTQAPEGIPGASRWQSDPAAAAWAAYAATSKPTHSPPAEAVEGADKPSVALPVVVRGSGWGAV